MQNVYLSEVPLPKSSITTQIRGIDYAATRRPQRFVCGARETRETITAATYVHEDMRVQRININIYVCVINRRPAVGTTYETPAVDVRAAANCLARKWSNSRNNVTFEVQRLWVMPRKLRTRRIISTRWIQAEINFLAKSRRERRRRARASQHCGNNIMLVTRVTRRLTDGVR